MIDFTNVFDTVDHSCHTVLYFSSAESPRLCNEPDLYIFVRNKSAVYKKCSYHKWMDCCRGSR